MLKGAKSFTLPGRILRIDTNSVSSQWISRKGSGKLDKKKKITDYWKGKSHGNIMDWENGT